MQKNLFLLAFAALLLAAAPEAKAVTVTADSPTSYAAETGLLTGSGTLLDTGIGDTSYSNTISGQLANNTIATFTFSSSWEALWNRLSGTGSYSYTSGTDLYTGKISKNTDGVEKKIYKINGVAYVPTIDQVLISAVFDSTGTGGSVTISNFSGHVINYATNWLSDIADSGGTFLVSYRVSGVPLPAALPLFGVGLMSLAAVRRKKAA